MNEKEKETLQRFVEKAEKLDEEDQRMLLGVATGMEIAKSMREEKAEKAIVNMEGEQS